jgi:CheY-like chemotaxis protein
MADFPPGERVVKYLCPGCNQIVNVDLEMDEVESSSSSASYKTIQRTRTILVADDSTDVLEMAEGLLTRAGYIVVLASDGDQALERIRDSHPDLVVLDLLMPRRTGFDVIREIKKDERTRDTMVLAISGVYKDNILEFLQQLGVQGFLSKEQIPDTLVFRVEQILGPAETLRTSS